ncbi:hypothetical protein C943_04266 [Mariniradius saccharolyticus AK6]|uniref:Uncharacterized protein n=1 Tax=Mariniradius saccharolyticus AK6 TaxID=1239962 RepID=M7XZM2_9BACT|nr:hypothetical protein C943_04266 [Mariniradius saccharolyticus AK6]
MFLEKNQILILLSEGLWVESPNFPVRFDLHFIDPVWLACVNL